MESKTKWIGGAQRKELVNEKVKDMVIGTEKTKKCSKNPWECKNGMGQGYPKE